MAPCVRVLIALAVALNFPQVSGLATIRRHAANAKGADPCEAPPFDWQLHFAAEEAHDAAEKAGHPSNEEIEAAVQWRMGPAYNRPIMPVTHLMVGGARNGVVYQAPHGDSSLRAEYICGDKSGPRVKGFLQTTHSIVKKVLAAQAAVQPATAEQNNATAMTSLRIFADWEDARSHHLAPRVRPGAAGDVCAPVQFTFNRQRQSCLPPGARSDVATSVLWPPFFQTSLLSSVGHAADANLLTKPRVLTWRGQGSGTCDDPVQCDRCLPLMPDRDMQNNPFFGQYKLDVALKAVFRKWTVDPAWISAHREDIDACLMSFLRWRAFYNVNHPTNRTHGVAIDVKLGPKAIPFLPASWNESAVPVMMRELFGLEVGEFVELQKDFEAKYRLALEGNDYSSSLPHDLTSGAVVLSPPMRWEWKFNYLLKPWIHYIPLQRDLGDLDDKIEWCEGHPKACNAIARRAHAFMKRWHGNLKIEMEIQRRVLQKYASMYGKGPCGDQEESKPDFENCVAQSI